MRSVVAELRLACFLAGSRTPQDLARAPLVLGPNLRRHVPAGSPLAARLPW
jgi:hypothetical protein